MQLEESQLACGESVKRSVRIESNRRAKKNETRENSENTDKSEDEHTQLQ